MTFQSEINQGHELLTLWWIQLYIFFLFVLKRGDINEKFQLSQIRFGLCHFFIILHEEFSSPG